MKSSFSAIIIVLLLLGCQNTDSDMVLHAYVSGEINNPTSDYITFREVNSKQLDTVYLDETNRFSYQLDILKPSIHFFNHGGEYQMLFLEPKDSIMLKLNTSDFDESLVYTGNGAKKNNWIIRSFLDNEKKARKLSEYFKMEPEEFHSMIERKRLACHQKLAIYLENNSETEQFIELAKAQIDYGHFALKEIYPFGYFGNNKMVHLKDLPENFYAFRTQIDFNAASLSEVYAYNRYLFSFFDNIAVHDFYKDHEFHDSFNRELLSHSLAKLKLIDSVIEDEKIKNNLLKFTTRNFIISCNDIEQINIILTDYLSRSEEDSSKQEMSDLAQSIKNLQPGNKLPNIELVDVRNQTHQILDLIDSPTVIYFWSSNYKRHLRNIQQRILKLKDEYPNIKFIAININSDNLTHWEKTLESTNFDLTSEFRFKNESGAKKAYAVNSVSKVILVDVDHNIIHPNAKMFGTDIDNLLAGL